MALTIAPEELIFRDVSLQQVGLPPRAMPSAGRLPPCALGADRLQRRGECEADRINARYCRCYSNATARRRLASGDDGGCKPRHARASPRLAHRDADAPHPRDSPLRWCRALALLPDRCGAAAHLGRTCGPQHPARHPRHATADNTGWNTQEYTGAMHAQPCVTSLSSNLPTGIGFG